MRSLFLIGPRGAGKTAAGAAAARRLGVPFIDTDTLVEQRAGRPVADLFVGSGEPAFRELERDLLLELLRSSDRERVVATGGGCVLDDEVRAKLGALEGVVWLTGPAAVLQDRIRGSDRPSLTGDDPASELPDVIQQREPLYRAAAARGLVVDTGQRSVDEVAWILVRQFRRTRPGGG